MHSVEICIHVPLTHKMTLLQALPKWKKSVDRQKMQIFKVWDIVMIIKPRQKTHQTHVSSALKTFYHHLRRL